MLPTFSPTFSHRTIKEIWLYDVETFPSIVTRIFCWLFVPLLMIDAKFVTLNKWINRTCYWIYEERKKNERKKPFWFLCHFVSDHLTRFCCHWMGQFNWNRFIYWYPDVFYSRFFLITITPYPNWIIVHFPLPVTKKISSFWWRNRVFGHLFWNIKSNWLVTISTRASINTNQFIFEWMKCVYVHR